MTNQQNWASYSSPLNLPLVVIKDTSQPLVSIVTPSFNQGKFIRETIESVLSQDYPNIEYWVIDGGSQDETVSICKEYEHDSRFHWLSEKDRGHADAVNKGWCRCRGEIFGWLNSDDTYLASAVRTQVNYLAAHLDVDVVYGDCLFIDANSKPTGKYWGRPFSLYQQLRYSCVPQPTAFLRAQTVRDVGPLDLSLRLALDVEYWLRIGLHHQIRHNPHEIATYRFHDESATISQVVAFNQYLKQIVDTFYAQEAIPKLLSQKKSSIYADLMLSLGTSYAKSQQPREALKYLRRSFTYSSFRPRMLSLSLYIVESVTGIRLSKSLETRWMKFKNTRNQDVVAYSSTNEQG